MAKDKLTDYDATASNNTDIGGIDINQGTMIPSNVDNAIREIMSHLKDFAAGTEAVSSIAVSGDLTVDTNTLKVDSTNNRVGIGTASPAYTIEVNGTTFQIAEFSTSNSGAGNIQIADGSTTAANPPYIGSVGDHLTFGRIGVAEYLRIQSGGGISFNGDTAAANALDDYEEGTWTPTASANVDAISSAEGFYTKIGNTVVLQFKVGLTPTSTSGGLILGGLPFAVSDKVTSTQVEGTGVAYEDSSMFVMFPLGSTSTLQIELDRPIQGSASGSAKSYRGNFTYFTG